MVSALCRWPVILLVAALAWSGSAVLAAAEQSGRFPAGSGIRAQPQPPLPDGQRITAADGDTVVIDGEARVRIIRRRPAFVRMVANAEQRFVIILAENLREHGDSPARVSEKSFAFNGLQDPWPFASRWEGTVWLEEYFPAGSHGWIGAMLGIETPEGRVIFANLGSDLPGGDDTRTTIVRFQGMSGGGGRQPFDQEEVRVLALAAQNAASATNWQSGSGGMNGFTGPVGAGGASWFATGSGGVGVTSEIVTSGEIGPPPAGAPPMSAPPLPAGAVRAGGNIVPPRKIHNVDPVMPDLARSASVSGTVILEITIGVDGGVSDARVLRSIPLLDQAALDAVRQWKYEPTLLNGQPVPVIITVPIPLLPAKQ